MAAGDRISPHQKMLLCSTCGPKGPPAGNVLNHEWGEFERGLIFPLNRIERSGLFAEGAPKIKAPQRGDFIFGASVHNGLDKKTLNYR